MTTASPILITGSQRSGTTLLLLILDSHAQVTGIDEPQFYSSARSDSQPAERIAYKLPMMAHEIGTLVERTDLQVVWCLRDPRAVVSSMLTLELAMGQGSVPWIHSPHGGIREIECCAAVLGTTLHRERQALLTRFAEIRKKPPPLRRREEGIFAAALCWRLKQELLLLYRQLELPLHLVRYEELVQQPKPTITSLLEWLNLPWHEDVLRHHQLHQGRSIGDTDNQRAIDATGTEKWRKSLQSEDLAVIRQTCGDLAVQLGYFLED